MNRPWYQNRLLHITCVFTFFFGAVTFRLIHLGTLKRSDLKQRAQRQHFREIPLMAERGAITDRHGEIFALSTESAGLFVRPPAAQISAKHIAKIAEILDTSAAEIRQRVHSKKKFVWLSRRATPAQADAIIQLELPGIGVEASRARIYPLGPRAGQVIGFTGMDALGLEGIEQRYDTFIQGSEDTMPVEMDAKRQTRVIDEEWLPSNRHGARAELTLDAEVQRIAEEALAEAVISNDATAGVAAVMDPWSGELLALANFPFFDPATFNTTLSSQRRNRVIQDNYEPGSTFKGILAAAAIETGAIHPSHTLDCEQGRYAIGGRVIHDHDPYARLSITDIIKHSSNIGATKIAERMGAQAWAQAIRDFGFGRPTGIDLPGEASGIVPPVSTWRPINLATISFGQGIAVTPIQLLRAYAALANGGTLLTPYVVKRLVASDGTIVHENTPTAVGRPISAQTASIVTTMLQSVVADGTGRLAQVSGIAVAGKTGTAQKVDPETKRYSDDDYMASFIGFLPAEAPRFVILVVVDSPQKATYGGTVAGPVFQHIATYLMRHHGIVPPALVPVRAQPAPIPPPVQLITWPQTHISPGNGLPNLIGMSLREALQHTRGIGIHDDYVSTTGAGFVRAQSPPPGTLVAPHMSLQLHCDVQR